MQTDFLSFERESWAHIEDIWTQSGVSLGDLSKIHRKKSIMEWIKQAHIKSL